MSTIRKRLGPLIAGIVGAIIGASAVLRPQQGSTPLPSHDRLAALAAKGLTPAVLISMAMWVVFSLYWEAKATGASAARRSESRLSRAFHLIQIGAAQLLVLFPVPGLRMRFLPASTPIVVASLFFEFLFFALAVWARHFLGRNWSGAVTTKINHELIRRGPYRFVRHPIYSAMLGAYLSTAFASGELRGLIGFAIACLAYWRKTNMEEQYLRELFGPAYEAYKSETRAIIPGIL